ncbi:MAG: CatB-related O-acetyltransferase [Methylococcales bacterium]|jgi:hypothetical protein|nr:CatB-related O-acetyltransferase [Methylococcales bacterium]
MELMNKPPLLVPLTTGIQGNVVMEENVRLYNDCELLNVFIGAFTHVASGAWLLNTDIGRYCSIGDGVHILTQQPIKMLTTSPLIYGDIFDELARVAKKSQYPLIQKTIIGNDVWIGSGVKIKTGLTIGDGAVIGAGAVVTKNIAPYSVVAGVPAKVIKMRFPPKIIARLNKIAWWQYKLTDYHLEWDDINLVLKELEKLELDKQLSLYVAQKYKIFKEANEVKGQLISP